MQNIIVHYGEIALKKGNREYYERVLCENIRKSLAKEAETVKRLYGRKNNICSIVFKSKFRLKVKNE